MLLYLLYNLKKKRKVGKRKEETISSTIETSINRTVNIDVVINLGYSFSTIVNATVIVNGIEALIDVPSC